MADERFSNLTGRYLKVISLDGLGGSYGIELGEFLKVTDQAAGHDCIYIEKYHTCARTRINDPDKPIDKTRYQFELMPIGFSPDIKATKGPNLVPEKWYTCTRWSNHSYAKFEKLINDQFYFTTAVSNCEDRSDQRWWVMYSNDEVREVDISEVVLHLPLDHPDYLAYYSDCGVSEPEPIIPVSRFNVGDKVMQCAGGHFFCDYTITSLNSCNYCTTIEEGCTRTITEKHYNKDLKLWWYKTDNYDNYFTEPGLQFAPEEAKFKNRSRSEIEVLLSEARTRYSRSTVFDCAKTTVKGTLVINEQEFRYNELEDSIDAPGVMYVFYQGKWAHIVAKADTLLTVNSSEKTIYEAHAEKNQYLLDEADRKYPIGSKVICPLMGNVNTVEHPANFIGTSLSIEMGRGYVHHDGNWANAYIEQHKISESSVHIADDDDFWDSLEKGMSTKKPVDTFNQELKLEKISKATVPKFDQKKFLSEPYNQELKLEKLVRKKAKSKNK